MTIKSGRPYTSTYRCRWKQRPLLQRELGKERQWLERRGNGRKLLRSDRETRGRHPQVREIERAWPFSAALSDQRDASRKKRYHAKGPTPNSRLPRVTLPGFNPRFCLSRLLCFVTCALGQRDGPKFDVGHNLISAAIWSHQPHDQRLNLRLELTPFPSSI